ncbi:MAG TPA: DUF3810 family protein [Candidatus Tumulicola sp.]|nr:DUF3810 family protein [Candidatus Tumulicola sp.]
MLGVAALAWKPSAAWVESAYANGAYPSWEHAAFAVTSGFPWSLGDVAGLLGIAAIVWRIAAFVRPRRRRREAWPALVLDLAAIAGLYAVWFEASWGWNYARAPLEARLQYDPSRVTPAAAIALRGRAIAAMNALAPAAHAAARRPLQRSALNAAWLPLVQRAGDDWTPHVGDPKPTIANPFMQATGTSGFINPLTLNVQLAGDVLWFERPFDLAHEWSHVAAYAREDEANYLAIVTCLRSPDPVVRYSGWIELFLYLPQKRRYARSEFVPQVWQDFAALRRRDARHVNVLLAHWTWRTYNVYLKSNRIASGVENYNEVTRLILGIPLDRIGLPVARAAPF